MIPLRDHTGLLHFHSSTISGSASSISSRTRASVSPRQSASSRMRASMSFDAGWPVSPVLPAAFGAVFFLAIDLAFAVFFAAVAMSLYLCQHLFELAEELCPAGLGAAVGLLLFLAEA